MSNRSHFIEKNYEKKLRMKIKVYSRRGELVHPNDYSFYRKNSLRLKNYDYRLPGPYFVTICTDKRINLFKDSFISNYAKEIIKNCRNGFIRTNSLCCYCL